MSKHDRHRRPARKAPFRNPKPIVLVVTEGAATEPEYLIGLKLASRNSRVDVKVHGAAGVPRTIVELAKGLKRDAEREAKKQNDENLRYDQVWCVFDVDDHPGLADAKASAGHVGIDLAISNPCIELWLLLHFREPPGLRDRSQLRAMLKKYDPAYDKHVDFELYRDKVPHAIHRAERLHEAALTDGEPDRNPSTGMWRLVANIRDEA